MGTSQVESLLCSRASLALGVFKPQAYAINSNRLLRVQYVQSDVCRGMLIHIHSVTHIVWAAHVAEKNEIFKEFSAAGSTVNLLQTRKVYKNIATFGVEGISTYISSLLYGFLLPLNNQPRCQITLGSGIVCREDGPKSTHHCEIWTTGLTKLQINTRSCQTDVEYLKFECHMKLDAYAIESGTASFGDVAYLIITVVACI
ncbi:uncharacterized protein EDB93DRAFT_1340248 [Suillus bovinus]|uniref:uncharacterized protein n=1 Tax=Suillus bovinus TaxID=48563 RepID=UPI001B86FF51|nr:uncharacterized protein EDB93DRAFT_1340248 [Suillus bovinus]KAG2131735.1 hypothetical protein EDB93DRAFT_1340248 [Suillus bovinus]